VCYFLYTGNELISIYVISANVLSPAFSVKVTKILPNYVNRECMKSLKIPKSNQNPYIKEEQTTQKGQKDKQRSTKHTCKTKDRVTRAPLKTGDELRCSGRVSSYCSTSSTSGVNLVTNPVISREWGKDREVFTTSGTYPWSFVTQIYHNGQPSHGGDRKIFEVLTSTLPKGTLGSVASLLAVTLDQGNPDRNHKLWNIVSTERYILHM
jgi:hypothetical protein